MQPPAFLVIGAAHWDRVATASTPVTPGADVPGRIARRPGGVALNLALALAAEGAGVALVSAVGRDDEGAALCALAAAAGIDVSRVLGVARPTGGYLAIETPAGELFAAVADCAALEAAAPDLVAALAAAPAGACLVADGNLPAPVLDALLARGGRLALVPASPAKAARLAAAPQKGAALYLNRAEAEAMLDRSLPDAAAAARALRAAGARRTLVTDGARPAALAEPGLDLLLAPAAGPGSVTGAGDALAAAHLAAVARGLAPEVALRHALARAAAHRVRTAS